MADAIRTHLEATDLIARVMAEMEEVIGLIERPCAVGSGRSIAFTPPQDAAGSPPAGADHA